MHPKIQRLRNSHLTGHERHPYNHHYQVRRCDVIPGLKILSTISTSVEEFGTIAARFKVTFLVLCFSSFPQCREGHWYAMALNEETGETSEVQLYNLGIVPDFILRPKGDMWDPAGWNPYGQSLFRR